jgi:hypothetical protein
MPRTVRCDGLGVINALLRQHAFRGETERAPLSQTLRVSGSAPFGKPDDPGSRPTSAVRWHPRWLLALRDSRACARVGTAEADRPGFHRSSTQKRRDPGGTEKGKSAYRQNGMTATQFHHNSARKPGARHHRPASSEGSPPCGDGPRWESSWQSKDSRARPSWKVPAAQTIRGGIFVIRVTSKPMAPTPGPPNLSDHAQPAPPPQGRLRDHVQRKASPAERPLVVPAAAICHRKFLPRHEMPFKGRGPIDPGVTKCARVSRQGAVVRDSG